MGATRYPLADCGEQYELSVDRPDYAHATTFSILAMLTALSAGSG